jgi:hypothetical protein
MVAASSKALGMVDLIRVFSKQLPNIGLFAQLDEAPQAFLDDFSGVVQAGQSHRLFHQVIIDVEVHLHDCAPE